MYRRFHSLFVAGLALLIASSAFAEPPKGESDPLLQRQIDAVMPLQSGKVSAGIAKLAPQRPRKRDIYFLGVAGWGDQDVFRKEVRAVRSLFEKSFSAKNRAISLVNHAATLNAAPLATHETIEAAVLGIAGVMDPQEDLLVMFLTSHGAEQDGFALELNGKELGRLQPAQLARILNASDIRNRVVVVSSCFSGQFVPDVAEENTLLITSAASDRASFGCTSTAEWTYFGRAFFKEALPKLRRFQPAFEAAIKRVEAWEDGDDFTHSEPQFRMGEKIKPVLDELGL